MPGAHDPLAHLRTTARTPVTSENPTDPSGYEAFGVKDKLERLKIRRASGISRAPAYASLLDVIHDGTHGSTCILLFTFVWFKIKGRYLQPLFLALESGTVDFIQEYDPGFWVDTPLKSDQPVIESIEVVQNQAQTLMEIEALGKQPA